MSLLENIPLELRRLNQWVAVDMSLDPETNKPKKLPLHPRTRELASVIDPSTWGTFQEACMTGGVIGLVFTEQDPYAIIDLDNKPERPLTEGQWQRHQAILSAFDSYTEKSISGRGYHIIVKGRIPRGVHRDAVEVYSSSRYMICTGDVVRNAPINDYQHYLDKMYVEMSPKEVELVDRDAILSDEELIEMAMTAVNADKFNALCSGDMTGYPSQSEADFALLSMFAFYTKDNEQVRRLFRYSALGKRDKAVKNDVYLNRALQKIRAKQGEDLDLSHLVEIPPPPPPVPCGTPPEVLAPLEQLTLPRGLVGELASYFYATAVRPVPEVALAAAIAFTAGICGRSYNISNSGLNQYIILLATTGRGKEGALAGIENMVSAVRKHIPMVDQFIGPAAFASGQALVRVLDEHPCFVSVLGEFGLTLQQLSDSRTNAAQKMLKRVLLDIYAKSGWNRHLRASVYSDSDKNTNIVQAPNVTILGESTPETFFDGLDGTHISEGLIPRFSIIEYTGGRPKRNRHAHIPPSPELVAKVCSLITTSLTISNNGVCAPVQTDANALALLDAFDDQVDAIMNGSKNQVETELWNRAHLKALKLSALLAVGVNPQNPVVTLDMAEWALAFVKKDIAVVSKRFLAGDVGVGDSKQYNDLRRVIDGYYSTTLEQAAKYGVTDVLFSARLVPYCYLVRKTASVASFRSDRLGATAALKRTVQSMIDSGYLIEISKADMANKYKFAGVAYGLSQTYRIGGH